MKKNWLLLPLSALAISSVTGISMYVLSSCSSTPVSLEIFEVNNGVLFGFNESLNQEQLNNALSNYEVLPIPSEVTEISPGAFSSDRNLKIPSNIKTLDLSQTTVGTVGNEAFLGAPFEKIIFRNEGIEFSEDAFTSLKNLKNIDLSKLTSPEYITPSINLAFNKKHPLKGTITLRESMTKEDVDKTISAFGDSFLLNESSGWKIQNANGVLPTLEMLSTGTSIHVFDIDDNDVATGFTTYFQIILDSEKRELLRHVCSSDAPILSITNDIKKISDYAFYRSGYGENGDQGCSTIPTCLTELRFEPQSNCIEIGKGAFESCKSLKKIWIPHSVTTLGSGAFSGCTALESINILDFESIPSWSPETDPFKDVAPFGKIYYNNYETNDEEWKTLFETITPSLSDWTYKNWDWDPTLEPLFDIFKDEEEGSVYLDGFNPNWSLNEIKYVLHDEKKLVIPKEITAISDKTFWDMDEEGKYYSTVPSNIEELEFEENSQCIQVCDWAFRNAPFKKVTVPSSIIHFGDADYGGFCAKCEQLSEIDLSAFEEVPEAGFGHWMDSNFAGVPKDGTVFINASTSAEDWNELFNETGSGCTTENGWKFEFKP